MTEMESRENVCFFRHRESDHQAIQQCLLKALLLETILGPMVAVADEEQLFLLQFADRGGLDKQIFMLQKESDATVVSGRSAPLDLIERELELYFQDSSYSFTTPVKGVGSPFQQRVWKELRRIPPGETRSYGDIARSLGHKAARAVGYANSSNRIALLIPCHRVINTDRRIGGYRGGTARKKWLLEHEGVFDGSW